MAKLDYSVGATSKEKRIMDAKAYCKKTAAFAGWLIQNVPSDVDMDRWMNDPEGTKQVLAGFKSLAVEMGEHPSFSIIATTNLIAIAAEETRNCFPSSRYVFRDKDFDRWLPSTQPESAACIITAVGFTETWTFAEAAAAILGVSSRMNPVLLGERLIENGYIMTLPQAEEMVKKTGLGEKTGVGIDGYGNFFFVATGNGNNPVSVGAVNCENLGWNAHVRRLDHPNRWYSGGRCFLIRDLGASKL